MNPDHSLWAMKQLSAYASVVSNYSASESAQATANMLRALVESYKLDLMHVTPEGLIRLQALIQQAESIRAIVAGELQGLPKV